MIPVARDVISIDECNIGSIESSFLKLSQHLALGQMSI